MGTDEAHIKICSLVWEMCVEKNPPSIWLTLNLADTQDPITQVFCGKDIDLDNFSATHHQLSNTDIAADPYASATFFHFIINAILEGLLGIQGYKHHQKIKWETGILGIVEGYIGTVKAQGRGTLHLHILLWLRGSPTSDIMKDAYKMRISEQRYRISSQKTSVQTLMGCLHVTFSPFVHNPGLLSLDQSIYGYPTMIITGMKQKKFW
jgi:hypothetical protein